MLGWYKTSLKPVSPVYFTNTDLKKFFDELTSWMINDLEILRINDENCSATLRILCYAEARVMNDKRDAVKSLSIIEASLAS